MFFLGPTIRSKFKVFAFFILIFLTRPLLSVGHAGSVTLTTYYPSPQGAYDRLRLIPVADLGASCPTGTIYTKLNDQLQFCGNDPGGTGSGTWGPLGDFWMQNGDDIYPNVTSSNFSLQTGIGTTTPTAKLTVNTQAAGQDVMHLTDQGASVLTVKDGGGVGINNSSPAARLSVNNSGTEDILNLNDNGTEVFTILDGGNVGIGIPNPLYDLHVGGDGQIMLENATNPGVRLNDPAPTGDDSDGPDYEMRLVEGNVVDQAGTIRETHNEFQFRIQDYPAESSPIPALTFKKSTWEGGDPKVLMAIGIEDPRAVIDIRGDAEFTLEDETVKTIFYSKPHDPSWVWPTRADQEIDGSHNMLCFNTVNYEGGTVLRNGCMNSSTYRFKFGIRNEPADPSADYEVDVIGIINLDVQEILNAMPPNGPPGFTYGYRKAGSCLQACPSSRQLKKNIQPISRSLERIMKLEPVSFVYKDPEYGRGVHYGFVAEDVVKIFPEWVHGNEPKNYSINYGPEIDMNVIQAVKEMKDSMDRQFQMIEDNHAEMDQRIKKVESDL